MAKPKLSRPSVFTLVSILALATVVGVGVHSDMRVKGLASEEEPSLLPTTIDLEDALKDSRFFDGKSRTYRNVLLLDHEATTFRGFFVNAHTVRMGVPYLSEKTATRGTKCHHQRF